MATKSNQQGSSGRVDGIAADQSGPGDKVVLLVEPQGLPFGLTTALEKKGFWVEETELIELAQMLVVTAPRLVICRQRSLERVLRSVSHAETRDRTATATFALLEPDRSQVPPESLPPGICGTCALTESAEEISDRIARQLPKYISQSFIRSTELDAGEDRASWPSPLGAPTSGRRELQTLPVDVGGTGASSASDESPSPLPAAGSNEARPTAGPIVETGLPVWDDLFEDFADSAARSLTTRSPRPSEPFPEAEPDTGIRRVDSAGTDEDQAVRVVLRDPDRARAAKWLPVLREAGHRVFVAAEPACRTPWPQLRRFTPQFVVINEVCRADDEQWLLALRNDLHLRHLATVPFPLDRDPDDPSVDLGQLFTRMDALVRGEWALLGDLSSPRTLECELEHLGVPRLLDALERQRPAALLCLHDGPERLRWGFARGEASVGLLDRWQEHIETSELLAPSEALVWLLEHPRAGMKLQVLESFELKTEAAIGQLLRETYDTTPPPTRSLTNEDGRDSAPARR